VTAYDLKREFDLDEPFKWQAGYGVMSFGTKRLPYVVAYINHQKQHHSRQTTEDALERDDD